MWLLIAFLAVPMIEITLFIQVGSLIGLWPTLGIVVATAVAGSWIVRSQGAREIANLRASLSELRDPTEPLANGAMILLAGALLLTPGFFTDAIGLLLLIPQIRAALMAALQRRIKTSRFEYGETPNHRGPSQSQTIDADFVEVDTAKQPTHEPSGWTRH